MQRAGQIVRKDCFNPIDARDRVTLEFENRYRRRIRLFTENHRDVLVDFDECQHMRDGDAILLSDGSLVLVCARPEELLEITAPDPAELMRIAWHLGNRHLPVQFADGCLRIRFDPVIAGIVCRLGGTVDHVAAAFDPENAAGFFHGAHE
jgi:urease accessory protein